ncbi:MAG: hypothetical protein KIS78_25740 [Labilithrix sp.]|nr:hypothetical protein [Labilithrix sp.]MCW5835827.1 hypothetical protein [Labilithrix sp.]
MTSPASDVIHCPLCDVPHRTAAVVCDGCGQALHAPLNLGALRDERDAQKRNIVLAVVVIAVMLALNVAFFGGGAYVIATAPLGWLIWTWIRFRALSRRLARASERKERGTAR